jgi:2-dehydropantoate 2-reductase
MEDEGDISHLLITTKSWSAGLALQKVRHRINHQTTLVAMMNGMQHIADLRAVAPECPLFLASTTAGCHRR